MNKLNVPPFAPLQPMQDASPTMRYGDGTDRQPYYLAHVARDTGEVLSRIYMTPRELRQLINDIEAKLPDPFATCDFCGAEMGAGDNVNECGHVEGQGGAAGVLETTTPGCAFYNLAGNDVVMCAREPEYDVIGVPERPEMVGACLEHAREIVARGRFGTLTKRG